MNMVIEGIEIGVSGSENTTVSVTSFNGDVFRWGINLNTREVKRDDVVVNDYVGFFSGDIESEKEVLTKFLVDHYGPNRAPRVCKVICQEMAKRENALPLMQERRRLLENEKKLVRLKSIFGRYCVWSLIVCLVAILVINVFVDVMAQDCAKDQIEEINKLDSFRDAVLSRQIPYEFSVFPENNPEIASQMKEANLAISKLKPQMVSIENGLDAKIESLKNSPEYLEYETKRQGNLAKVYILKNLWRFSLVASLIAWGFCAYKQQRIYGKIFDLDKKVNDILC